MELPGEAFDRRKELSKGEFELYIALCKYRCWKKDSPDYGLAFPGRDILCKEMHAAKGYVSSLMSSLVRKRWIEKIGWKTRLLTGFDGSNSQIYPDKSDSQIVRIQTIKSQNSAPKKSENGHSHIKELEVLEEKKIIEPSRDDVFVKPAVISYLTFLDKARLCDPKNFRLQNYKLNLIDAEQIIRNVDYPDLFTELLEFWLLNRYQMNNLGNILAAYRDKRPQWIKEHPSSSVPIPPDVPIWDGTERAAPPPKRERVN